MTACGIILSNMAQRTSGCELRTPNNSTHIKGRMVEGEHLSPSRSPGGGGGEAGTVIL